MIHLATSDLVHFPTTYGYWAVLLFVAIESTGIPFPGETMLLATGWAATSWAILSIGWRGRSARSRSYWLPHHHRVAGLRMAQRAAIDREGGESPAWAAGGLLVSGAGEQALGKIKSKERSDFSCSCPKDMYKQRVRMRI